MTTKTPVANYSPENVILLEKVYGSANTDAERKEAVTKLASTIGKTVNSIRAKLSKMGIYVKPEKTTKVGSQSVRKSELVSQISDEIGVDKDLMGSIEGSTKFALEKIMSHMLLQNRIISDLEE